MDALWLLLFAITAGFVASGITANLYRVSGARADTDGGRMLRMTVMVIAGPSVIFETAMRGLLAKTWTKIGFSLAMAGVGYWSMVIGLLILDIALHV